MVTDMERKKYIKIIYAIITLYAVILICFTAASFFITKNIMACLICAAGIIMSCIPSYALYKADDKYISGIILRLSELMDVLVQIDGKDIFPDSEDTVLSKLQYKVIKLSRILKNNSIREKQEHENIKKLVSDIAHQLKTPIASLKIYSRLLSDESLSAEKQREYIDILCTCIERLDFLSENIIKTSRLESGLINLDMQKQSLNETVLKAVKDIYVKAKQSGIEIKYDEKDKINIKHDRNWTAEAIFNLLDNAIKYGNKGNTIYLSIRNFGMFAEIAVEDENGGISYNDRNNIFMRFYRGKNSSRHEGLGIGLYLAREITNRQGGYINFSIKENKNRFSIFMFRKAE